MAWTICSDWSRRSEYVRRKLATSRRGSLMASPKAAKLPISHSGRNAWCRRICRARWRCGPSSSEKAMTHTAEKQVPTTSA